MPAAQGPEAPAVAHVGAEPKSPKILPPLPPLTAFRAFPRRGRPIGASGTIAALPGHLSPHPTRCGTAVPWRI